MQCTSLAHLLNAPFLRKCFMSLNRNKAVGQDNLSWHDYAGNLDEKLFSRVERLKSKRFRPIPARRVYIPKGDDPFRLLGISVIENKIVERGITWILQRMYEPDAQRMERVLKNRFNRYGLEIHPEKSRRMSVGRYEAGNSARSERRANTFDFLGFTHYCDRTRQGGFKP